MKSSEIYPPCFTFTYNALMSINCMCDESKNHYGHQIFQPKNEAVLFMSVFVDERSGVKRVKAYGINTRFLCVIWRR